MSPTRQNPWKEQLWNVSLLPAMTQRPSPVRPARPEPVPGDRALDAPAVLSLSLDVSQVELAEAA
ncbi:MAG TPA: hypothetical protein VIW29_12380 [Polyangiaceae bacterium]